MAQLAAPADFAPSPPPLDEGLPLVGHLPDFVRNRGALLLRLYRKHGPCFRIKLGPERPIVMAGPEMAQFVGREAGQLLLSGPVNAPFVAEFGGDNCLLGADLGPHQHRRRQLVPQFSPRAVMRALPRIAEVTREALPSLCTGSPVDLVDALKRLVSLQAGLVLTGADARHLHEDICTFVDGAVAVRLIHVLPEWTLRLPRYRAAKERVLAFCRGLLEERRAMAPEDRPGDLVDVLVDATEPDGGPVSEGERAALVVLGFAAGLDTVAFSTAFLLYELLAAPALRERVVAEADALFPDGTLDVAALPKARTLQAAVTETLRRYPLSDIAPRVAGEPFDFAGRRIEKGEALLLAYTVSHALPELFRDPDRFDPDRCLPPREEHTRAGAFGAFGFGPHRCIGARLGEAQMAVTVAAMLRFATLRLDPPGAPLRVSTFPMLRPKALRVAFELRPRSSRAPRSGRTERNWLGNVRFQPATREAPSTLAELRDAVRRARDAGLPVRVGGTGHSWTPLAATDGALIHTGRLSRVLGARGDGVIEVEAGVSVKALAEAAAALGLSVPGTPIYSAMSAAGLAATGSHGTGLAHPCFSEAVVGMTLVTPDGEVVEVDESDPHLLRAARVSLGLLGAVYSLRVRCQPERPLLTRYYRVPIEEGLASLAGLARRHAHVAVLFHPFTPWLFVHASDPTDAPARYGRLDEALALGEDFVTHYLAMFAVDGVARHAPGATPHLTRLFPVAHASYEQVWSSHHAFHYIGTVAPCWLAETSVPVEHAEAAFRHAQRLIADEAERGRYPVNLAVHARFVKAGDAYLSMTRDRDSCCIDVATSPSAPGFRPFVDRLHREMAARFGGRPHWGKALFRTEGLRALYGEGIDRFEEVRRALDPGGVLLGDFLRPIFAPREAAP